MKFLVRDVRCGLCAAASTPSREPDGFVRDRDTALGEQVFDVAEAERESVVEPDGVADDRGREAVGIQLPCPQRLELTMPDSAGALTLNDNVSPWCEAFGGQPI